MLILRGLDRASALASPTAVAIGNFDGLHLGHQAILRFLVERAKEAHLTSLVLTFSPHPEKILGRKKIAMIQTLDQRLAGLKKSGVQAVVVVPFDLAFSRLSSQEFFDEVLLSFLKAKEIVVGRDFRFGSDRRGDVEELCRLGSARGVVVHAVAPVRFRGQTVRSSLIRSLLWRGEVEKANLLLGHSYEIEGKIIPGSARGRRLGFPTANILTENEITPQGVFLTEAQLGRSVFPSVSNIGFRPTFGSDSLQIEAFLLNIGRSLYDQRILLRFLRKLREEKKFPTPQALILQVRRDIEAARKYFAERGPKAEG